MSHNNKTVGIYTLGCKVNQYESEAIAEELCRRGFVADSTSGVHDAYVINTCTVTAESDRKARQLIRRVIGKNPEAPVVVTGCMAQISADEIASIEGVDAVVGNTNKVLCADITERLLNVGKNKKTEIHVSDIEKSPFEKMSIERFDRTRAYVKIEDGCESRCTYCIIPDARGGIRSKPVEDIIREVTALTVGGCREIVLTGIETGSYGKDLGGVDLADLLAMIDKIEGIGRVRLGSLDPSLIKENFVKRIAELHSLAPHFHLSLQSGSSRILALMKRKYNARQAMAAIELLRKYIPDVKFTTDIIVGFPQESEEDFLETAEFVKNADFLMAHIFPYSKRKDTPAAAMSGQIPKDEKSRRLHILSDIEAEVRRGILEREIESGKIKEVLFETFSDGVAVGHTADFLEVHVPSPCALHAKALPVRFLSTDGSFLFGEIV